MKRSINKKFNNNKTQKKNTSCSTLFFSFSFFYMNEFKTYTIKEDTAKKIWFGHISSFDNIGIERVLTYSHRH